MKTRMTIKIKKRTQPGWLIWLIVVMPFLFGFLNEFLRLPWAIRYLLDGALLGLVFLGVCFHRRLELKPVKLLLGWCLLFLLYTMTVYLIEFQSPLYYVWGLRNNFRFYVAFFACCIFLKSRDLEGYFRLFDGLFWVSAVLSLYQFFILGVNGDYLGGIFGTSQGVNGYTNIFFVIVIARALLLYLEKREKLWLCITKCVIAILVAALAEIKFFFVEAIAIFAMAILLTDFTWRKLLIIIGGVAVVSLGATILVALFPGSTGFLSSDFLWNLASSDRGYTSAGDLNRLNAIPQINELWLNSWGHRLFGLGLGNCDTSNIAALNTPFYQENGDMHYTWMSHAFMYLECGWIGLVFYYGFFVLVFLKTGGRREGAEQINCYLARILMVCCILMSAYNASLRMESAYMVYFVLATPFVYEREKIVSKRKMRYAEQFTAETSVPGESILR